MSSDPELTVSMPAYGTARFLGAAIDSVLRQRDVDLELVVIDDGSPDDVAGVVQSYTDRRVRLLRNPTNRGIAFSHNRVIAESRAPFIAHVDSDDFLIGSAALARMVDVLRQNPEVGQVHGHFFDVDAGGRLSREAARRRWEEFAEKRTPERLDYRHHLLATGAVMNHLRVYRRAVFEAVGDFNQQLPVGEDLEMALRLLDRFDIQLVPEFVYARRVHPGNTEARGARPMTSWLRRVRIVHGLMRSRRVRWLGDDIPRTYRALGSGLLSACGFNRLRHSFAAVRGQLSPVRVVRHARWRLGTSDSYRRIARALHRIPPPPGSTVSRRPNQPVAYALWRYPALTETFMRREIRAVMAAGVPIVAVSATTGDQVADAPVAPLHVVMPDEHLRRRQQWRWLWRRPLMVGWLFFVIVGTRYAAAKSLDEDLSVLDRAVALADALQRLGVGHVHAPWADGEALVALVAARLLGVPYSVQPRGYDMYRARMRPSLAPKLLGAQFIVTNSAYNVEQIGEVLGPHPRRGRRHPPVHLVYEGIDPTQFTPPARAASTELRILAVGRVVEQKGFRLLMEACATLRTAGRSFRCDVIGDATEDPAAAIDLRLTMRRLQLADSVRLRGALPTSEVVEAMAGADLFVLPCVVAVDGSRDVTPNVIIEAMAMALPVVSTRISGVSELVVDGETGLLVPPGDPDALGAAIATLMDDAELRRAMGAAARLRAERQFDAAANYAELVRLFST